MSSRNRPPSVVVVGAGVAGLIAARDLAARGATVVVVDKGRGVGGRLATRRVGDATFDHGAQFVTARSTEFSAEVAGWVAAGVATPWFDEGGVRRHRGVPAMTGIAKHLGTGLDVRLGARVSEVRPADDGWRVEFEDRSTEPMAADAVVLTPPAPQTLALLDAPAVAESDRRALESIAYDPCIAVMVTPASPSPAASPERRPDGGPVAWYADNQAKGVSRMPAVTIHAGPEASRDLWDSADDEVIAELVGAIDLDDSAVVAAQVHRWRYARAVAALPEPCRVLAGVPPAVVAGDGFGAGGRVETAALSGAAAATALAARLGL